MLQGMFALKELPKNLDATDGLAAAVCHFYNAGKPEATKAYHSWSSFVSQNKDRTS
jgi:crossover junction endodeoxyribonuclease RuvC